MDEENTHSLFSQPVHKVHVETSNQPTQQDEVNLETFKSQEELLLHPSFSQSDDQAEIKTLFGSDKHKFCLSLSCSQKNQTKLNEEITHLSSSQPINKVLIETSISPSNHLMQQDNIQVNVCMNQEEQLQISDSRINVLASISNIIFDEHQLQLSDKDHLQAGPSQTRDCYDKDTGGEKSLNRLKEIELCIQEIQMEDSTEKNVTCENNDIIVEQITVDIEMERDVSENNEENKVAKNKKKKKN